MLGLFWAPGQIKKVPLDINTTTHLSGTGGKVDPSTGDLSEGPLVATSVTRSDSDVSTDNVIVYAATSCLMLDEDDPPDCVDGDDPRLVSATESVFAQDRKNALTVKNGDYVPAGTPQLEGLVNKFPFDTEKKTYPYWDDTVGSTVDATYDRSEKLLGVDTYVFKVVTEDAPIEVAEGVSGTYDDAKEIYVEPLTGAIIQQTDEQTRTLDDGTVVLQLQLGFTEDQQKTFADDAKTNRRLLNLVTTVVPIVGIVGGLLAIAGGFFLGRGTRRKDDDDGDVYAGRQTTTTV